MSTTDTLTATNTDSYNTYSSNHGNSRNRLQQGYSVMSSTERYSDLPEFNYNSSDVIQRVYIKRQYESMYVCNCVCIYIYAILIKYITSLFPHVESLPRPWLNCSVRYCGVIEYLEKFFLKLLLISFFLHAVSFALFALIGNG